MSSNEFDGLEDEISINDLLTGHTPKRPVVPKDSFTLYSTMKSEKKEEPVLESPIKSVTAPSHTTEQITVEVYGKGKIPKPIFRQLASVMYPPTKWSRFMFVSSASYTALTDAIQHVLPGVSVDYKPNKAETMDMIVTKDGQTICKVNFIHMDKPDSPGCSQIQSMDKKCKVPRGTVLSSDQNFTIHRDSSKCFLHLMFFYPTAKQDLYQIIRKTLEDFIKHLGASSVSRQEGGHRRRKTHIAKKRKRSTRGRTLKK